MNPLTRRQFLERVVLGTFVSAIPGWSTGKQAKLSGKGRPHILLLMTDQHRFDALGSYGNPAIHTPHLDAIAKEGVLFTAAYTSTPSCTPARAALLTGLSPWHHGMLGYGRVARRYRTELPRTLRKAGYFTVGIGKMHWYPQRNFHGFHRMLLDESGRVETPGFVSDYRRWFKKVAPELDPDATGLGWNDYRSRPYALPEELHPTRWIADRAVEFIQEYSRPQPFFLKVSFERPHSPYDPPQRFFDAYRDEDMPGPWISPWAERFAAHPEPPPPGLWHGNLGLAQVRRSRRGYYGSVSFVDEQIGRILKALKDRGLYENTLILFLADHGDMLGDHHLWRKTYAYEGSSHIPMILRWPRTFGLEHRRGSQIAVPVEVRDVLPTLLDAAGALIPDHLDGRSLLELVRNPAAPWREWIDLEHAATYSPQNYWSALADGRWKYIYHAYTGEEQLFNVHEDPGELHDLAKDAGYRRVLRKWRDRLIQHLSERGEPFVAGGKLLIRKKSVLYSPCYPEFARRR